MQLIFILAQPQGDEEEQDQLRENQEPGEEGECQSFHSLLKWVHLIFMLAPPQQGGEDEDELRDEGRKENQEPQGEDEGGEC